jgi:ubiquitin-protein ligase/phage FluMu protein Com
MSQVRLRRLQSDFERLTDLARRHPRLSIVQAVGSPPDRYQISYRVQSLRKSGDTFTYVMDHLVEITLPAAFPRTPPLCRMLTPVFHPNIAPHAICIGDHWSPGESLSSLVIRIAEILAFQSYNTRSPLNGEAAKWVEENVASLPLDAASMTLDDAPSEQQAPVPQSTAPRQAGPSAVKPSSPPTPSPAMRVFEIPCSSCAAMLRISIGESPVRVRCPKCRELTTVGADGRPAT